MNRRHFIKASSSLVLSVWIDPTIVPVQQVKMERIAMGTVIFRYRFPQTQPKEIDTIPNPLTLLEVPAYYKKRFGITRLEFWSNHFESTENIYLQKLKAQIKTAGSKLVNVQVDSSYDLASSNEESRLKSIEHVKRWIDATAMLGSECVRVNPGGAKGSEKSSMESMKIINDYARQKKIILLTENHFGIEINPQVHLRINQAAGPSNIYTLPDFGNYPQATMFESLKTILPAAYLVSAKAAQFNDNMEHMSYDFDKCVQLCESSGFKGVYSLEQWDGKFQPLDYEKVADWLIEHVKRNI